VLINVEFADVFIELYGDMPPVVLFGIYGSRGKYRLKQQIFLSS